MPLESLPEALYRAEQVRALDRCAIEDHGIAGYTLMGRAGEATLERLRAQWPEARRILVFCGGGNNGGDGYVIARLALAAGLDARVVYLSDPAALSGDAATAWRDASVAGVPISAFSTGDPVQDAGIVVDALLGTGLERVVRGIWAEAIETINRCPAPVVAVDIPSGLHAGSGAVLGVAVRADITVSFIGLKTGLFTGRGPAFAGQVFFSALQVPDAVYRSAEPVARLYRGDDRLDWLAPRDRDGHKGRYGHVLVVGGNIGFGGAARMAAEAAARSGAGLVSAALHPAHAVAQAATCPEVMFRGVSSASELDDLARRATVLALGPGLGVDDWARTVYRAALALHRPLVLDADGLNLLAQEPDRRDDWILTPHPGEAGRLLGCETGEIESDRLAAAARIQRRYGGVCLLKGAGTVVADADDGPWICTGGNPGMASGGMGDVLTGVVSGLLAQGLPAPVAARLGVHVHASAADAAAEHGERGLLARDLMAFIRRLVNP
jgi:NAD(P)H-hydrate epimerase